MIVEVAISSIVQVAMSSMLKALTMREHRFIVMFVGVMRVLRQIEALGCYQLIDVIELVHEWNRRRHVMRCVVVDSLFKHNGVVVESVQFKA